MLATARRAATAIVAGNCQSEDRHGFAVDAVGTEVQIRHVFTAGSTANNYVVVAAGRVLSARKAGGRLLSAEHAPLAMNEDVSHGIHDLLGGK